MTNYELLIQTVNTLAPLQGLYSRIKVTLDNLSDYERNELKVMLNKLPQWNDYVDVIMYIEPQ